MPSLSSITTLASSKKLWYIIVALAAFIGVAIYVYSYYIAPTLQPAYVPNQEFQKEKASHAQINLFYVDWCPHSKNARKEWNKVKEQFDKKMVNGTVLEFVEINGEEDDGQIMNVFETKHGLTGDKKVDGYPTIILVKGDQVIEFDAKPNKESLTEFINTSL
jgi:hypothetical protein